MCNLWHLISEFGLQDPQPSYGVRQFKDEFVFRIVSCCICKRAPQTAKMIPCHHIFCVRFSENLMKVGQSCPECSTSLLVTELSELTVYVINIYENIQLNCANINSMVISFSVSFFYTCVKLTYMFDFWIFIKIKIDINIINHIFLVF